MHERKWKRLLATVGPAAVGGCTGAAVGARALLRAETRQANPAWVGGGGIAARLTSAGETTNGVRASARTTRIRGGSTLIHIEVAIRSVANAQSVVLAPIRRTRTRHRLNTVNTGRSVLAGAGRQTIIDVDGASGSREAGQTRTREGVGAQSGGAGAAIALVEVVAGVAVVAGGTAPAVAADARCIRRRQRHTRPVVARIVPVRTRTRTTVGTVPPGRTCTNVVVARCAVVTDLTHTVVRTRLVLPILGPAPVVVVQVARTLLAGVTTVPIHAVTSPAGLAVVVRVVSITNAAVLTWIVGSETRRFPAIVAGVARGADTGDNTALEVTLRTVLATTPTTVLPGVACTT